VTVTVVIPTLGGSSELRGSVEDAIRAAAATGPDAEVLVVVNGGGRAPALANLGSPLLRVLYLERANVSLARNVGIAAARHDTVIFGDDGIAVAPTWCTAFAAGLRDPRYPVATAPVHVPVTGPVTALLDYQRVFEAMPLDATEARTLNGHCAIRRDRIPAHIRYDEENLPVVGEDLAFGATLRAAGIPIRWLPDVPSVGHVLTDRIEEITDRAMRYGRATVMLWRHGLAPAARPSELLAGYRYAGFGGHRLYRRFTEVVQPAARAAFTVYDYLFDLSFLIGYLAELGDWLAHPFIELDQAGLRGAWQDIAARTAAGAGGLTAADWRALPVDYTRLDDAPPTDDPLVADVRYALARYAPPVPGRPPAAVAAVVDEAAADLGSAAAAPDRERLLGSWRDWRASGAPLTADTVNGWARRIGYGFRDACATIERAAARRPPGADRSSI
jgi:glycosyltransferase involved in cell wall biosynthesis